MVAWICTLFTGITCDLNSLELPAGGGAVVREPSPRPPAEIIEESVIRCRHRVKGLSPSAWMEICVWDSVAVGIETALAVWYVAVDVAGVLRDRFGETWLQYCGAVPAPEIQPFAVCARSLFNTRQRHG